MVGNGIRYERKLAGGRAEDQRHEAQRDRDRIIHSSALRRLGGVTQVVDPAEGYVFHNRLTHTLKVAQIARRLAEYVCQEQAEEAETWGGIDPEIVETAALAHDLGHPPFGHIAEEELDRLVVKEQVPDGFEGNPQSFRIINKLSVRRDDEMGLNLTRASLNAVLKYPFFRETSGYRHRKRGAYRTEEAEFVWVRKHNPDDRRSAEAELMDWADDIAYAVHDMEDFYRAGLIPLHRLVLYERERNRVLDNIQADLEQRADREDKDYTKEDLRNAFHALIETLPVEESYAGTRTQRAMLRTCTGNLIRRYVMKTRIQENDGDGRAIVIDVGHEMEIFLLKQLTRFFVIHNPKLASQQYGKAQVIRGLFGVLLDASGKDRRRWRDILPNRCKEELENVGDDDDASRVRLVADVVSSLSDREALTLHRRFLGTEPGSALEPLAV